MQTSLDGELSKIKSKPRRGKMFLGAFFAAAAIIAATKNRRLVEKYEMQRREQSIVSTNAVRTIAVEDIERGFVQTRTGVNEAFDFSPPANATVVGDWRAFGAAEDWVYANVKWALDDETAFRIHSDGWVEIKDGPTLFPFKSILGIVPETNWQQILHFAPCVLHSQVWHALTPENSLLLTWQNALYGRDAATPLSFQIEFKPDGEFIYRYDLSRLNIETVTNILAGASFAGGEWTTNSLATNVTSLAFHTLSQADVYNQDPDGDGISTSAELFVYNTNPRNADTDHDGLSDARELFVCNSDPLDPNSISATYCDGFAAKLGDLDPFSHPEGSTNTIYEHIFYTGTTNAPFAYPQSSEETAVLKIMVSGAGAGRMIAGDETVPLVAPPPTRSGGATNTLLLAVRKGMRKELWFKKPAGLDVAIDSGDLLIGRLPALMRPRGWLAFPHTAATEPCIHDLAGKGKMVSLVHGEEFPGLAATWTSDGEGVAITNAPPVSAAIHGGFSMRESRTVSYAIYHPDYICGETNFVQTLRFCPQFADEPEPGFPGGSSDGGEMLEYDACDCAESGSCSCRAGEWCHCECGECPCNDNLSPELIDDATAGEAFTNIVNGATNMLQNVLYLYRENSRVVHLDVPQGEAARCCPCPEHVKSNYVAKAYASRRVAVDDMSGESFGIAYDDCDVTISGVSPSREFGDASVLFVTNGATFKRIDCTMLGVKIDLPQPETPMARYNQLSPELGFPVEVCTNLNEASSLVLHADVPSGDGYIRIALEEVSGDFEIWLPEWMDNRGNYHAPEKLLDGTDGPERYVSMRQWRNIMRRYGEARRLEVKVASAAAGNCKLKFEYAVSSGERGIHDFAEQKITSVNPVLLVDCDRDGAIGVADIARRIAGRYAYFWRNDDKWKGDDAFDLPLFNGVNSSDDAVNGRNDLINFLPVAVDIAPFVSHWDPDSVCYRLESDSTALRNAKLAFADIAWNQIGDTPLGNNTDIYGAGIYEAPVAALGGGTNLPPAFAALASAGRSTLLMEFPEVARGESLALDIYSKADGALLFSSSLKLHVGDVAQMIGWENIRAAAGGSDGVPTRLATADWPAEEHEPGNIVFVHGYNMAEDAETPLWAKNVFKKLWWAGLDRGFIAIQWFGNEGQTYIPAIGFTTPNYYGNVQNAFATASALKTAMDGVPGPKWFLAHSLGNMLVSAAIQDCDMAYEKYFMLNAAVAMEAYDPVAGITQESHDNMTPQEWTNYVDSVRATHWFELFPQGDGRRLLTWKGRFANVTNIVNFYSSQEEVVNNGDGTEMPYGRNYSWYNQEYRKGSWPMMIHEYEGGWEFNSYYDTPAGLWMGGVYVEHQTHMPPDEAAALSNGQLQQTPFFLDFVNPEIHSSLNGLIVATNYLYRAEMLAYAIPSESYAVGANPLPQLNAYTNSIGNLIRSRNHDMASFVEGQDDLPFNGDDAEDKHRDWQHSTFVQRSYKRTHRLFNGIIRIIKAGELE